MDAIKRKKILILSSISFNDNVIPMFKAMQEKGLDVTCLIELKFEKACLINIKERLPKQAIIKASEYPEMKVFEKYLDINKLYFINHKVDKKHAWRELTSTMDIIRFINHGKYDIIHTDMAYWWSKVLLYFYRNKTVQITHDSIPHSSQKQSWQRTLFLYLKYKLIKYFVILNKTDYSYFCDIHKLNKEHVFINALGPFDFIRVHYDKSIKVRKNNILFFGRIESYKGLEYLCEAMQIVHKYLPDATLTIAGKGDYYFNVDEYKKLPYFEFINRFVEEEELARLIQQCEVSICPYTDATQSGSILTSFSFFKPVIASDLETLREVITDGYNGLLVPPKDSRTLAEKILDFLLNENIKISISKNLEYEFLNGERSWNAIVDKYISIYKYIISKK